MVIQRGMCDIDQVGISPKTAERGNNMTGGLLSYNQYKSDEALSMAMSMPFLGLSSFSMSNNLVRHKRYRRCFLTTTGFLPGDGEAHSRARPSGQICRLGENLILITVPATHMRPVTASTLLVSKGWTGFLSLSTLPLIVAP